MIINAQDAPKRSASKMPSIPEIPSRYVAQLWFVPFARAERIHRNNLAESIVHNGGLSVYIIMIIPEIPVMLLIRVILEMTVFMLSLTRPPAIGISLEAPNFIPLSVRLSTPD